MMASPAAFPYDAQPNSDSESLSSISNTPKSLPSASDTSKEVSGSGNPHRRAMILAFVFGALLLFAIVAIIFHFYRRQRRGRQNGANQDGSSISFHKDRMVVSNRPWHKSSAYYFSRSRARATESNSELTSTSGSESKTHTYKASEVSFSTINPSDSISKVGHPSRVYKFELKRKPLRTSSDLSALPESQGDEGNGTTAR